LRNLQTVAQAGFDGGEGFVSDRSETKVGAGSVLATTLLIILFTSIGEPGGPHAVVIAGAICCTVVIVGALGVLVGASIGGDE
jgi:hypothetical protein